MRMGDADCDVLLLLRIVSPLRRAAVLFVHTVVKVIGSHTHILTHTHVIVCLAAAHWRDGAWHEKSASFRHERDGG